MDNVVQMELRGGNMDILGMPLLPLVDGIAGSNTLDETIGHDIFLNKEKGTLKISLTWTSRGASGSIKGGLNFGGGILSITSTSTKPLSWKQI
jgi:hypothetical protein